MDLRGYEIFRSGKKKLRIATREAARLEVADVIRGVYLAKKAPYGYIISIEGSYIIGRSASKRVAELTEEEFLKWMRGEDILKELPERGVYLVKYGPVFAGSGYHDGEVLRNLMPRVRVMEV